MQLYFVFATEEDHSLKINLLFLVNHVGLVFGVGARLDVLKVFLVDSLDSFNFVRWKSLKHFQFVAQLLAPVDARRRD